MNDPEKVRLRLSPPERRDRIIASAKTVLAKGGLRGFGLAAVAREAGIAIGLIGHYFGGIDGLVRAMLASVVANRQDRKHHTSHRCCQTNANQSPFAQSPPMSGSAELTPLAESGGAAGLEAVPAGEGALRVEQVVDRGVDGDKLLQRSHPAEAEHGTFPSSERLM